MENLPTRSELLRIADARLHPSLTNPNYLVLHRRAQIIEEWLRSIPGNELAVLDIGGRYQPYRPLLEGRYRDYFALDVLRTPFVSVIGSGEHPPFKENTFDLIIATGVFEYFGNPHEAAKEMHRILKPGGSLIMSVASVAPRFVDEERWRFTPRGLATVLAPFDRVTITPEVFSPGGFCRFLNLTLHEFLRWKPLKSAYGVSICPVLNLIGRELEAAGLTSNDQWAGNYSALAIR